MRELLPVLLVLFGLLLLATAASVGVVWWLSGGWAPQQVGAILVFEVDPAAGFDPLSVDMQEVVDVLDRRINPGWTRRARLSVRDDRRIEVGVFSNDPDIEQWVVDRIEPVGTLEFRILAQLDVHGPLVQRAMQPGAGVITDGAGEVQARWVPVAAGKEMPLRSDPQIVTRAVPHDGLEVWEVLVVHDGYHVTGAYLKDASATVDPQGQPCIAFTLNSTGGKLLAGLTGNNTPNFTTGTIGKLGILLNGRLHSAPEIYEPVHRQGMITGSFSEPEAMQIADTLRGGPLPAPLKRVERRTPILMP